MTERRDTVHSFIKETEVRTMELSLVMKHVATYRQSKGKGKFLCGHESKIILFEAAARELKKRGAAPLPSTESIKKE